MKLVVILAMSIISASPLYAASFDCAKATHPVEQMICSSPELSSLDSQLSANYKMALEKSTAPEQLKASQRAWIKKTRECQNDSCLLSLYKERNNELVGAVSSQPNMSKEATSTPLASNNSKPTIQTNSSDNNGLTYGITAIVIFLLIAFALSKKGKKSNKQQKVTPDTNIKASEPIEVTQTQTLSNSSEYSPLNSAPMGSYRVKILEGLSDNDAVREDLDSIEGKVFERGFGVELTQDDDTTIESLYIHFGVLKNAEDEEAVSCLITEIILDNPNDAEIDEDAAEQICYYVEEKARELATSWPVTQKKIIDDLADNAIFVDGKRYY